jgi:hypothetical protein
LARATGGAIVSSIAPGGIWYALSAEVFERLWQDILDRPNGPMAFHCLMQPVTAAMLAFGDGTRDAHLGRSLWFWTALSDPEQR